MSGQNACFYDESVSGCIIPVNANDPSGMQPGDSYPSPDAAAISALKDINPTSIKQNLEYGGRIYKFIFSEGYSYTDPNKGTKDSVHEGLCVLLDCIAGYHTHAAYDPGYKNEYFSPADIGLANSRGQTEYLATPSGNIKKYDPSDFTTVNSIGAGGVIIGSGAKKDFGFSENNTFNPGVLLYPNKSNNNQIKSVYQK